LPLYGREFFIAKNLTHLTELPVAKSKNCSSSCGRAGRATANNFTNFDMPGNMFLLFANGYPA
jgi:hypothetical protein